MIRKSALLLWGVASALLWTAVAIAAPSDAEDVEFSSSLINQDGKGRLANLSRFSKAGSVFPGQYRADVFVEGSTWVGRRDITIKELDDGEVMTCFTRTLLDDLGVDFAKLKEQVKQADPCLDIVAVVPGAFSSFDGADLRLDVSIPQKYRRVSARGYVSPEYWDAGAPIAGFLNYNANAYHSDNANQYYLGTNMGLNLGLWRLRSNGSANWQENGNSRGYRSTSTYAQRDLTDWQSVLTLGDYYTPSELFSGVPFRGVQINSDDRMLPDSLQGYAPVVRGVAETNAKVSIRQNGNLIYETTVSPGEFSIDDLYDTGYGGDLEVTVTEADGRVRSFTVPFAAIPRLLRSGQSRHSFIAGQWREGNDSNLKQHPSFIQGTYQRGLNNLLTLYTGAIMAEDYESALVGSAVNTPFGALSIDATQSRASQLAGRDMSGQSYRITYSKLVENTQTNFNVAAYRYSTEGYLEFSDYVHMLDNPDNVHRAKSRFQVNVDQSLGEGGRLYLMGSAQNYWNKSGHNLSYQLGYNNNIKWLDYSLMLRRTYDGQNQGVNEVSVVFSFPLGEETYSPTFSTSYTRDSDHNTNTQLSMNGTLGELRDFSYNTYVSQAAQEMGGRTNAGGGSVQYGTSFASLSAGASHSKGGSQMNVGASGALVFHPGGVTASQPVGESFAVIQAPGAEGASVTNTNGVRINEEGYAVVSNLMPYRRNEVTLDPKGSSPDVELENSALQAVPRAGAIVMMKFKTRQGTPVIVTLKDADGKALPLGGNVSQEGNDSVAVIGQKGQTFLRGLEGKTLVASWGMTKDQQCSFSYQVPDKKPTTGYLKAEAVCQ